MRNLVETNPSLTHKISFVRIMFEDFEISGPANGECTNDTLMFSGFDAVSNMVVPMELCGVLTGEESK